MEPDTIFRATMNLDDHRVFTLVRSVEHEGIELVSYLCAVTVFDDHAILTELSWFLGWLLCGWHKVIRLS